MVQPGESGRSEAAAAAAATAAAGLGGGGRCGRRRQSMCRQRGHCDRCHLIALQRWLSQVQYTRRQDAIFSGVHLCRAEWAPPASTAARSRPGRPWCQLPPEAPHCSMPCTCTRRHRVRAISSVFGRARGSTVGQANAWQAGNWGAQGRGGRQHWAAAQVPSIHAVPSGLAGSGASCWRSLYHTQHITAGAVYTTHSTAWRRLSKTSNAAHPLDPSKCAYESGGQCSHHDRPASAW